jgi:hypothetical protein
MTSEFTPPNSPNCYKTKLEEELKQKNESEYLVFDVIDHPKVDVKTCTQQVNIFYKHFPYTVHTVVVLKEGSRKTVVINNKQELINTCVNYNNKGYNIYFMVNEGTGVTHPDKKTPRSRHSVKFITNCFMDTDGCPYEQVKAYLDSINLMPHLVINSSEGKYHWYFHIDPIEPSPETVIQWKAVQDILHRLGDVTITNPAEALKTDATMADYSKLLRVPGFFHASKKTVVTVKEDNDSSPYTLEQIFSMTNAQSYIDYNKNEFGGFKSVEVPSLDGPVITAGDRFRQINKYCMHVANDSTLSRDEKYSLGKEFILKRASREDTVYIINNELTDKSIRIIQDAINDVDKEIKIAQNALLSTAVELQEDTVEEVAPSFVIPDRLILDGPLGDLVKQILKHSSYPNVTIAFSTALAVMSGLKGRTHFAPKSGSPCLYILTVGDTGVGKSEPMTMMQNTIINLGYGSLVQNSLRSDQGILTHMSENNSMGIITIDEIAPFLKVVQSKRAAPHEIAMERVLLKYYGAAAMHSDYCGKVGGSKNEIVLHNPMLAVQGFTVPYEFETLFNIDALNKGLLSRFLPFEIGIEESLYNEESDKYTLKDVVLKSDLFPDRFVDAEEMLEDSEGEKKKVKKLQNDAPLVRKNMIWTPDAYRRAVEIIHYYRSIFNKRRASKDPDERLLTPLTTRYAEQCIRMACVFSKDEIELSAVEYSMKIIEFLHQATFKIASNTIGRGKGTELLQTEEYIIAVIERLTKKHGTWVPKASVYDSCRKKLGLLPKPFYVILDSLIQMRHVLYNPRYINVKNVDRSTTVEAVTLPKLVKIP